MGKYLLYEGFRSRIVLQVDALDNRWLQVWHTKTSGKTKERSELIAEVHLDQIDSLISWLQGVESDYQWKRDDNV